MTLCACCGSTIQAPFSVSLDTNTATTELGSVKLSGTNAEIATALARRYPAVTRHENMGVAVWGEHYFDMRINTVRVHVSHARKALEPIGLRIVTVHGTGYRLEMEH